MRRAYLPIIAIALLAVSHAAAAQSLQGSDAERLKAVVAAAARHFTSLRDAPSNSTVEGVR